MFKTKHAPVVRESGSAADLTAQTQHAQNAMSVGCRTSSSSKVLCAPFFIPRSKNALFDGRCFVFVAQYKLLLISAFG
jgi:hypothetical protein